MALYPPSFQRYIGYRALISFYRKESTLPKLVRQTAKELGIYFVYLPPYSPNLNPIEFIWKSIKRVLSISFVPNLAEMRRIITESFCRFAECKSYAGYWIEKFILNNKYYKNLCV